MYDVPVVGVTKQVPAEGAQDATKTYSADPVKDPNVFVWTTSL